jgi:hypothetical protein
MVWAVFLHKPEAASTTMRSLLFQVINGEFARSWSLSPKKEAPGA